MANSTDTSYYQSEEFKRRIDKMFGLDVAFGWGFVIWLWATYAFVYFMIISVSPYAGGSVMVALTIGGLLVCIYNTASITAMVRHYKHDKEFIYTVDLRHLDAYRASKSSK